MVADSSDWPINEWMINIEQSNHRTTMDYIDQKRLVCVEIEPHVGHVIATIFFLNF